MNETGSAILWTSICWIVAFVVFACAKLFGKRSTGTDSSGAERDCRRAADNNRELAEQERSARKVIEDAERENQRASELVREQAEDYRRAGENNQRARELIKEAHKILSSDSDK